MKLRVMSTYKMWFTISAVVILIGLISLFTRGLNYGIDFSSGTLFWLEFPEQVTADQVRAAVEGPATPLNLQKLMIQKAGGNLITLRTRALSPEDQQKVLAVLSEKFPGVQSRGVDLVDPRIGKELTTNAIISVALASIGILAYIALRFEYRFGVAGVVALIHDVLVTLGLFSLLRQEVNSPFVAALLTVVGYSINDTIVVFDRIRENLRNRPNDSTAAIVDDSINQTLTRSINTSLTTLLAVLALFIFGSSTIRDFTLALVIGITVGTYSSIFIASPIWAIWREWDRNRHRKLAAKAR